MNIVIFEEFYKKEKYSKLPIKRKKEKKKKKIYPFTCFFTPGKSYT